MMVLDVFGKTNSPGEVKGDAPADRARTLGVDAEGEDRTLGTKAVELIRTRREVVDVEGFEPLPVGTAAGSPKYGATLLEVPPVFLDNSSSEIPSERNKSSELGVSPSARPPLSLLDVLSTIG